MQYKLVQLIDYLYDRGFSKDEIIVICNSLKNEQQIEKLMLWRKEKPLVTTNELRKKSIEISYDIYDSFFTERGFTEKETQAILDEFKQYDFIDEKKLNIFIDWIKNHKNATKTEMKSKIKDFTDKYAMGEMLKKYGGLSAINKMGIIIMKKIHDASASDLYNKITENSIVILNTKDDVICEIIFGDSKVKIIINDEGSNNEMYCQNEGNIEEIVKIVTEKSKD